LLWFQIVLKIFLGSIFVSQAKERVRSLGVINGDMEMSMIRLYSYAII
jgi:hypothetical protein